MNRNYFFNFGKSSSQPDFIMLIKTDNAGTSGSNEFTIPTSGGGYNYDVVTSEQTFTNQTGNVTLTWAVAGTYEVKISGDFPSIRFNNGGDRLKLLEVQNWGNIVWSSNLLGSFTGCENMDVTANDTPVFSFSNTSLSSFFRGCSSLVNANGSIGNWDVSNVNNMSTAFRDATSFNQDISNWITQNVTNMTFMFRDATSFNQDISNWITQNVTNMSNMFENASSFNQDIGNWNTENVTNMSNMFRAATSFNQNLSNWVLREQGVNCSGLFRSSNMSEENYTDTLVGMINNAIDNGNLPINVNFLNQNGMTFDRSRSSNNPNFTNAGALRDFAVDSVANGGLNWSFSGETP